MNRIIYLAVACLLLVSLTGCAEEKPENETGKVNRNKIKDKNFSQELNKEMMITRMTEQLGLDENATKKEIKIALGLPADASDEEMRTTFIEKNPGKPGLRGGN